MAPRAAAHARCALVPGHHHRQPSPPVEGCGRACCGPTSTSSSTRSPMTAAIRMLYFTGGRTFAYDVTRATVVGCRARRGGAAAGARRRLRYDPFNDEAVLSGGGHVAERGRDGELAGHTGTWIFECAHSRWRRLAGGVQNLRRALSRAGVRYEEQAAGGVRRRLPEAITSPTRGSTIRARAAGGQSARRGRATAARRAFYGVRSRRRVG